MAVEPDIVSDLNNDNADPDVVLATDDVRPITPQSEKVGKETTPPVADKTLSLRDQISNALKGEADTPPVATQAQDGSLPRNPDGTFAPRQAAETPQAPVDPSQVQSIPTPRGFDPSIFQALPAETQVHLARTMDSIGEREQRLASLDQLEQLIAPRRQAWALNGMTEGQAVNQLLALSDFAGRDPVGFIRYMAQNTGVNLEEIAFSGGDNTQVDPNVAALQQQVQQLNAQLTGFTTQQQQAAHNGIVQSVIEFASEKGPDGNLMRPYFDELGESVLPFISMVRSQNPSWNQGQILQEAYERACWGTPYVRAKMQAAVNTAGEAERLRQAATKASAARAASVSVRSGAPSSPSGTPQEGAAMSLRDTIRASIAASS